MLLGLKLYPEGFAPKEIVRQARQAEEAGFDFVEMSDHFHSWLDRRGDLDAGHAGFAWSMLGMIAGQTTRIRLGTGVTTPTMRYHPAIIAQAAATMTILSDNRFFLGLGSGERLNEHIIGRGWRSTPVRHEMLIEAIQIIRMLWEGGFHSFEGRHLRLEDARIYDLPEVLPQLLIAAGGPRAARIAGEFGDGMFLSALDETVVEAFTETGNFGTKIGEMAVAFDRTKEAGLRDAARSIRWSALGIPADAEIPRASIFEQATRFLRPSDLAATVPAGPDPDDYIAQAGRFAQVGMDGVAVFNVGRDMDRFLEFAAEHLVDRIRALKPRKPFAVGPARRYEPA